MKTKKQQLIENFKNFNEKHFNQDQKIIAIDILKKLPESQVQAYADFLIMKRKTGFAFDYSPEIAKGRIITLRENQKRSINVIDAISENENKLIIGDNYNALKSLLVTHKDKIDLIYIDPPYNTEAAKTDGNHSSKVSISGGGHYSKFQYKDKFGRGGWLNMIKTRLDLAKALLSEQGVIFVSIDDSEQAYLKVLMDEIFQENNFVANIVWKSSSGGKNDNKLIPVNTEYILVYSKAKAFAKNTLKNDSNSFSKKDEQSHKYGKYKLSPLCWASLTWQISLDYTVYVNQKSKKSPYITFNKTDFTLKGGEIVAGSSKDSLAKKLQKRAKRLSQKQKKKINDWRFYWSKESLKAAWEAKFLELSFNKVKKEWEIKQKIYEKARFNAKAKKTEYYDSTKMRLRNLINDSKITSKAGNEELKALAMQNSFEYPKPVSLIKKLFSIKNHQNITILDFFAGTGTTGQAVLEMNREDEGNRNFILVTNNENNIAYDVTYERLHRIIKGFSFNQKKPSDTIKWLEDNKPFSDTKLRVIDIDDSVKIALEEDVKDRVYENCQKGLQLLDGKYNKNNLDLYYDLAALNPLENEKDKF